MKQASFLHINFVCSTCCIKTSVFFYTAAKLRAEAAEIEHNAQLATQEAVSLSVYRVLKKCPCRVWEKYHFQSL